jgi:hypothetical protein
VRVGFFTRFGVPVVLGDETDERVARLVRSRAGRSGVIACAIDASDCVRALVEGVLSSVSAAIIAGRRWVWAWIRHVVGAYLDGGNGVGKIPP